MFQSLKKSILAVGIATVAVFSVQAEETVKVGILHSLSGTMAISETSLRDVPWVADTRTKVQRSCRRRMDTSDMVRGLVWLGRMSAQRRQT